MDKDDKVDKDDMVDKDDKVDKVDTLVILDTSDNFPHFCQTFPHFFKLSQTRLSLIAFDCPIGIIS